MRFFNLVVAFCFILCIFVAKSENNNVLYDNTIMFPLSNFLNVNSESDRFTIGYQYNFDKKISFRLFFGFNIQTKLTSKPINAESDEEESSGFYFINPGLKIGLSKTRNLLVFGALDLSFSYDFSKIEGVNFSSLSKLEEKFNLFGGLNIGIEYFMSENLSLSIESGIFFNIGFGFKTARIGDNSQKDRLPVSIAFGIKPSINLICLSIYF